MCEQCYTCWATHCNDPAEFAIVTRSTGETVFYCDKHADYALAAQSN